MDVRNQALWLSSPGGRLSIGEAPFTMPAASEVVVRVCAIALNPIDAMAGVPTPLVGLARRFVLPWVKYPAVMGYDVAGDVVEVGAGVTRLRVGDRVLGLAAGGERARSRAAEGAFQRYVVLLERVCSPIPDSLPYEQAAVLPLTLSTAAAGLFEPDQLALSLPGRGPGVPRGQTVLVWGGSTSVGNNAIQLARSAGYNVIATASPKNFDRVSSLGAERCFDYHDPEVVSDIVAYLRGRYLAGTLAIGGGSLGKTVKLAKQSEGSRRVSSATPNASKTFAGRRARRLGVQVSGIWGGTPIFDDVGPAIFADFLPMALRNGRFTAAPDAEVVGEDLEAIPEGLRRLRAGVSARKLVVAIQGSARTTDTEVAGP